MDDLNPSNEKVEEQREVVEGAVLVEDEEANGNGEG